MLVYPKSKINIGLNIIGKREDGYHNISSVFYPIELSDILEIVKSDVFSFTSTGIEINCSPENNLIVKAYHLLKSKYQLSPVKIHLHKIVPTGAGLGGGSADATATLQVLNNLFDLKLTGSKLEILALELGSDCPFFVDKRPCIAGGVGELLSSIDLDLSNYFIKIVHPNIHVNTGLAFSAIKQYSSKLNLELYSETRLNEWQAEITNDFETPVFEAHTTLIDIKNKLIEEGAIYTSMSGSGSSIYGLYKTEPRKSFGSYFEWIGNL